MTDEELLNAVSAERLQSAGYEEDADLLAQRAQALNYTKGEMPDVPSLPNRSQAVSMDVADAVETALPDLLEIFTDGDDVLTFLPSGPEDEERAEQESDYVRKVIFQDNPGFEILYDVFKDALQVKTGVAMAWWEDRDPQTEDFTGKTDMEVLQASLSSEIVNLKPEAADPQQAMQPGQPAAQPAPQTFSFTAVRKLPGQVKIMAIPPEDFTVARDTVALRDTTYCSWRARPRAQDLLMRGVKRDVVDDLPPYGMSTDSTVPLARDTVSEHAEQRSITGNHGLRQVEIITHLIRIDADGSGPKYWKVETAGAETVLISKEQVSRINIAAITPYRVPHRFYGESLADKLLEIQRIKTALKRILLDSGYFALNQRMEVSSEQSNQWTISDLMRNEPMMPVRSKNGQAVRAITAGALNFNVMEALEYTSVEGEQRTGIVRNAQGLNPDTLHETASGVLALIQASQKRLRLIARLFAETGIKDLYLLVHALLREHADQAQVTQIRGKWVPIDPTTWGERNQMAIEVGSGSAGKAHEVQSLTQLGEAQEKIVQAQGGPTGPIVTPTNIYNLAKKLAEKSGQKSPDLFFTDPATAQQAPQGPPPGPDAESIKALAQHKQSQDALAQSQAELQQKGQLEATKLQQAGMAAQASQALEQQKAAADVQDRADRLQLEREKLAADDAFRRDQLATQTALKQRELDQNAQLERERLAASFGQAVTIQTMKDENEEKQRAADIAIQASEAHDAEVMDD